MPSIIKRTVPITAGLIDEGGGYLTVDDKARLWTHDEFLPAALGAHGGLVVEGVASGVAVPVSLAALPVPAVRTPIYDSATGAAAIAKSSAAHTTAFLLHWVTVHFNAAPTTSESLTVIRNSVTAAAYDTTLCKVNPSVGALTDIVYMPDVPLLCKAGDVIDVAFTNTDTKTYGVEICTEGV